MSGTKHEWAIMAALSAHDGCKSRNHGKHGMWMEAAIAAYQRVMREPAEGDLRARVCVVVDDFGNWMAAGGKGMPDDVAENEAVGLVATGWMPQIRWVEATVPGWHPLPEPVVEGEVVE